MASNKLNIYKITYTLGDSMAMPSNYLIEDFIQAYSPKEAIIKSSNQIEEKRGLISNYDLIEVKTPQQAMVSVELQGGQRSSIHYYIAREKRGRRK